MAPACADDMVKDREGCLAGGWRTEWGCLRLGGVRLIGPTAEPAVTQALGPWGQVAVAVLSQSRSPHALAPRIFLRVGWFSPKSVGQMCITLCLECPPKVRLLGCALVGPIPAGAVLCNAGFPGPAAPRTSVPALPSLGSCLFSFGDTLGRRAFL